MIVTVRVTAAAAITLLLAGSARADGEAARGEAKFADCAACHKAGEIADFRYSPAMKRSGIAWTPATLEQFIADPQAMVPGNRMPYAGMASAADRADLIAYLQNATR